MFTCLLFWLDNAVQPPWSTFPGTRILSLHHLPGTLVFTFRTSMTLDLVRRLCCRSFPCLYFWARRTLQYPVNCAQRGGFIRPSQKQHAPVHKPLDCPRGYRAGQAPRSCSQGVGPCGSKCRDLYKLVQGQIAIKGERERVAHFPELGPCRRMKGAPGRDNSTCEGMEL